MVTAVKAGAASLDTECAGDCATTAWLRPSLEDRTSGGIPGLGVKIAPDVNAGTSLLGIGIEPASGKDGGWGC